MGGECESVDGFFFHPCVHESMKIIFDSFRGSFTNFSNHLQFCIADKNRECKVGGDRRIIRDGDR